MIYEYEYAYQLHADSWLNKFMWSKYFWIINFWISFYLISENFFENFMVNKSY